MILVNELNLAKQEMAAIKVANEILEQKILESNAKKKGK